MIKVGDPVEVLNGRYAGERGAISYVYPNPYYVRVRIKPGVNLERTMNGVRRLAEPGEGDPK